MAAQSTRLSKSESKQAEALPPRPRELRNTLTQGIMVPGSGLFSAGAWNGSREFFGNLPTPCRKSQFPTEIRFPFCPKML